MATVEARLSRRRALKRMRKVSVVHDFGACVCGCSDHLWDQDAAEARARKCRPDQTASNELSRRNMETRPVLALTCSWRRVRPRNNDSRAQQRPITTLEPNSARR